MLRSSTRVLSLRLAPASLSGSTTRSVGQLAPSPPTRTHSWRRGLSSRALPPFDQSLPEPKWGNRESPAYTFPSHPLPTILRSLTPSGVDAQHDIDRVAAAIAFRNNPSPEYSGKWLPDIQRGVEIWADLCAKAGRRCEDWDPLQDQVIHGEEW